MAELAHPGQIVADRYELKTPTEQQLPFPHTESWIATDQVLSRQVRVILISPESARLLAAVDAARRTALVDNPHMVGILLVDILPDDGDDLAGTAVLVTEIPPGRSISQLLAADTAITKDNILALAGETASAVAELRAQGVRHLYPRADHIYLRDSGDVVIDGFGIFAALANADLAKDVVALDRDETRGLVVFFAALAQGRDFPPDPQEHDAVVAQAADLPDLPQQLTGIFRAEQDFQGHRTVEGLVRALLPWGEIITAPQLAPATKWGLSGAAAAAVASADPGQDPEPSASAESEKPDLIEKSAAETAAEPDAESELEAEPDDELESDADTKADPEPDAEPGSDPEAEPDTESKPGSEPKSESTPATPHSNRIENTALGLAERIGKRDESGELVLAEDGTPVVNATKVTMILFAAAAAILGLIGLIGLLIPTGEVKVQPSDSETAAQSEDGTEGKTAEAPSNPPKIANVQFVSPDAHLVGGDPEMDNPTLIARAADGDPGTFWKSWFRVDPTMSPMSGIGIFVQLEEPAKISEIQIATAIADSGGKVELRDASVEAPNSGKVLAKAEFSSSTKLIPDKQYVNDSFVLWVTELPVSATDGKNRLEISEITVK